MKKKIIAVLIHLELITASLFVIVPVIWIVMASFHKGDSLAAATLIPEEFTLENYVRLFCDTDYPVWFFNTLKIASLNAVLSVILVMVTSWIMSRFQFRGKKFGLISILILSMFPSFLSMTAIYTLF